MERSVPKADVVIVGVTEAEVRVGHVELVGELLLPALRPAEQVVGRVGRAVIQQRGAGVGMDQAGQPDRVRAAVGVAVLHARRRPRHGPAVRLLVLDDLAGIVTDECARASHVTLPRNGQ